ncbi:MAG: sigma 54-interacting transcriptional regulator [Sandaracinaceae bacterium]
MAERDTPGPHVNQAFVAVRLGERHWVVDLPRGESTLIGPTDADLVTAPELAGPQGLVRWDGERATLERTTRAPVLVVNGRRLQARTVLRPGDELIVGEARMVFGVASPRPGSSRRALTHDELRERLAEELARASRRGRPTALVMLRARPGEGPKLVEAALGHLRAGDVVATYAPGEIELVLPDTSATQARAVVERVVEAQQVDARIGIAVAPEHADRLERLLWGARAALRDAMARERVLGAPPVADVETVERVSLVAQDPASRAVLERITTLADGAGPVVLTGEPSSGRSAFARLLHENSPRAESAMIALRCARLADPERVKELLRPDAEGILGRARGGTLLLHEVSELPPGAQERLLDLLDAWGGDVRLVATTHLDLASLAERGAFSVPLARALAGEQVAIPPLRHRPEDIIPLAEAMARDTGAADPLRLSPGALARLRSHPWRGNVLELRNAMERAVSLAQGGEVLAEHLPSDAVTTAAPDGSLREHVDSVERDAIIRALAEASYNQTHAARRLGISRRALIYKMEKYGLKLPPESARR